MSTIFFTKKQSYVKGSNLLMKKPLTVGNVFSAYWEEKYKLFLRKYIIASCTAFQHSYVTLLPSLGTILSYEVQWFCVTIFDNPFDMLDAMKASNRNFVHLQSGSPSLLIFFFVTVAFSLALNEASMNTVLLWRGARCLLSVIQGVFMLQVLVIMLQVLVIHISFLSLLIFLKRYETVGSTARVSFG